MTVEELRQDRAALVHELEGAGARFKGNSGTCPFHNDNSPSLSLHQGPDQIWRCKCHATTCGFSGDIFDVRARLLGVPVGELIKQADDSHFEAKPRNQNSKGKRVYKSVEEMEQNIRHRSETFLYINPDIGHLEMVVFRIQNPDGSKTFLQARSVKGGFTFGAPEKPWPLYNRGEARKADVVLVVEGEKCVNTLRSIGVPAVTSPGGAGKASHANWSDLAGKRIYLWPDFDDPGQNHMHEVAAILEKLGCELLWIDPAMIQPPLPPKGDVCDYLAGMDCFAEEKSNAVMALLETARPIGPSGELSEQIEDTIAGRRESIPFPWKQLSDGTRALQPGTVTLLCGDIGGTKSFAALQAAAFWHRQNIKTATYELEDDRAFHLNRVFAQLAGESNLTNDQWVRANPERVRELFNAHKGFLDSFGKTIYEAPNRVVPIADLASWARDRAAEGCRIIILDPITAAGVNDKRWNDDLAFMVEGKKAVAEYGASLLLVTHGKKGRNGQMDIDQLSGGASYGRFSQTVLWLERLKEAKTITVEGNCGLQPARINRVVHIVKARNSFGAGLAVGFHFDGKTLTLTEEGVIAK